MLVNVAPLKYGVIFKKAFRHPDVFCAFVKDALGIEINVKEVREEYEYPEPVGHVKVRYDLFAEDLEKRVIVEIQHVRESDFYDRFLHYHITAIADQARSHEDYRAEKSVYTLVILTSLPRDKSIDYSVALVEFDAQVQDADRLGKKLGVYKHRMLLLNPKLVSEQTPPALRSWLELIKDSLDKKVDDQQYPGETFRYPGAMVPGNREQPWLGEFGAEDNERHPATYISWEDIGEKLLARWGEKWGIPSEAQWEYACRSGTLSRYYWGEDESEQEIGNYAWYDGNRQGDHPQPVGDKAANAWGLHDMIGNVYEWCADIDGNYPVEEVVDPIGATSGSVRVVRGGAWNCDSLRDLRSASRDWGGAGWRNNLLGGRLVREFMPD